MMKLRRATLGVATLSFMMFSGQAVSVAAQKAPTCKCPVLEKAHLFELYGTGETYDTYRGYIPHTKRRIRDRKSLNSANFHEAFKAKDGTCTCWYSVRDSNNRELDQLGLEELQPKLSDQETG